MLQTSLRAFSTMLASISLAALSAQPAQALVKSLETTLIFDSGMTFELDWSYDDVTEAEADGKIFWEELESLSFKQVYSDGWTVTGDLVVSGVTAEATDPAVFEFDLDSDLLTMLDFDLGYVYGTYTGDSYVDAGGFDHLIASQETSPVKVPEVEMESTQNQA